MYKIYKIENGYLAVDFIKQNILVNEPKYNYKANFDFDELEDWRGVYILCDLFPPTIVDNKDFLKDIKGYEHGRKF